MNKSSHKYQVKSPLDPRDAANVILIGVNDEGKKSNVYLREILDKNAAMDPRDKALAEHIVASTLDHLFAIDDVLNSYAATPVEQMNPYVRAALRSALSQMLFMDKIPQSAAIYKAVELTKLHGLSGLSGFVNGVLRTISREKEKDTEGNFLTKKLNREGHIRYSVPRWLYAKFLNDFGPAGAESIFQSWMMLRKVSVRYNLSKGLSESQITDMIERQGIQTERILDRPPVYELSGLSGVGIAQLEAFQKGYITVQDASAAMLTRLAPPNHDDLVLDLCAAPGGKTAAYADALMGSGLVISRDISDEKTSLIRQTVERCGFENVRIEQKDATVFDETIAEKADLVIVDAPCSGLGVVAKKPDIKKNIQPSSILSLQNLQREILTNAVGYVKTSGRLVYSTCTVTKEENEDNFDWICDSFSLKPLEKKRILPDRHHDGFFIAVFEKI